MAQPPVNFDTRGTVLAHYSTGDSVSGRDSGGLSPFGSVPFSWWSRHKPASVFIKPKDRDVHFTSWFNRGKVGSCPLDVIGFAGDQFGDGITRYFTYYDGSFWYPLVPAVIPAPAFNLLPRTLDKALRKLNSNSQAAIGVMLAEYDETAKLFSVTAERIAKQVKDYRNRRPKDWLKVTRAKLSSVRSGWRDYPQSWLELQYGWNPGMSDVLDSSKALNDRWSDNTDESKRTRYITVRARSGTFDEYESIRQSYHMPASYQVWKQTVKHRCEVKLVYQLDSPFLAALNSLGILNPLSLVWEKLRFSFVVDWFLPIGSWLQNFTADLGYDFVSGYNNLGSKSDEELADVIVQFQGYNPGAMHCDINTVSGGLIKSWNFDRGVYEFSPIPVLYFKNPLSSTHVANAMSLLTTAFHR